MAETSQFLTKTHLPSPALLVQARRLGEPENFYVGLPDPRMPPPRNILMFCSENLETHEKDASHHRHMLILNMETEASLLLDSLLLSLSPGKALLVFPFQAHRYLLQKPKPFTWLFITFELGETDFLADLRNRPVTVPAEAWPLVEALLREYRAAKPQKPADAVAAHLTLLLLRLLRQARLQPAAVWEERPPLPAHRLVQRACRLIGAQLEKPIAVTRLALDLSVSAGYLRSCFQRVIGLRVTTYIRRERAFAACSLLSRTEFNITAIADRCGFSSVYAFSRAFTREVGMAPTRYRAHLWKRRNIGKPGRKRTSPTPDAPLTAARPK